ncbi:MAG: amidohydrolase [Myxococcota bacterium]|jgi:amidohydrolase
MTQHSDLSKRQRYNEFMNHSPQDPDWKTVPADVVQRMVALRRDLHRSPELSLHEAVTAQRISSELDRLGLTYRLNVGGHGIVVDLPGREPGPMVALRADMDALPVLEETGLPFASEVPGVMHACGHDGHSGMLLGACELLLSRPLPRRGVRLLWQPAEELAAGAPAMVADGVLDGVGMIFGGHLDRHYPTGHLIVTEGAVNASTNGFEITIHGQQGHGARPHEALDAVVVGAILVTSLQAVVAREIDPANASVITVGTFDAGTAGNVIAGRARLTGTMRAQDPGTRDHLIEALRRVAAGVAMLHRCEVEVSLRGGTPPLINSPEMTAVAAAAAVDVVGSERVVPLRTANMGGEDFACFLDHVPGAYIRYGAQVPGREGFPAHSSRFDFDEGAMAIGAAWLARVAVCAGELL